MSKIIKNHENVVWWSFGRALGQQSVLKRARCKWVVGGGGHFKFYDAFWRHLVDSGCHCNVGATADSFGCLQFGGNHFLARYWQNLTAIL